MNRLVAPLQLSFDLASGALEPLIHDSNELLCLGIGCGAVLLKELAAAHHSDRKLFRLGVIATQNKNR